MELAVAPLHPLLPPRLVATVAAHQLAAVDPGAPLKKKIRLIIVDGRRGESSVEKVCPPRPGWDIIKIAVRSASVRPYFGPPA